MTGGTAVTGRMRTGFTTGACSAAAAKGATMALVTGRPVEAVAITLPMGRRVSFAMNRCRVDPGEAFCSVIKDGGDDPDVTHGAELCATAVWSETPGLHLDRGPGVGVVTKPGLGVPVGAPAINPVPRRMIGASVREGMAEAGLDADRVLAGRGIRLTVSCPDGEERARKTLNARLGIVGGISILGTTGLVIPYSTAAFRASIDRALDVAAAAGCRHVVLTTGGRSEAFAQRLLPDLPEEAFIQMGEFLGFALKASAAKGFARATVCGMVGKLSKVAAGHFHLHARSSEVDTAFLAGVAADCGVSGGALAEIRGANTARHVAEIVLARGVEGFFDRLCQLALGHAREQVGGAPALEFILTDFDGNVLGRAAG